MIVDPHLNSKIVPLRSRLPNKSYRLLNGHRTITIYTSQVTTPSNGDGASGTFPGDKLKKKQVQIKAIIRISYSDASVFEWQGRKGHMCPYSFLFFTCIDCGLGQKQTIRIEHLYIITYFFKIVHLFIIKLELYFLDNIWVLQC